MTNVEWRFQERDCPICGEDRATSISLGRRGGAAHRLGLGRETGIVRCRRCHGVYPFPVALPEGNPYLEHTAEDYFRAHDSSSKIAVGESLAREAETLLGSKGRLLEIGCGRGELLRGAANMGWIAQGIEMTKTFAHIAAGSGVPVEISPAETAATLRERWDVIVLAAILEHVYEPVALLARIQHSLRPGGIVFIDVPNECSLYSRIGNLYMRLTGRDWAVNLSPTFPPFHVVGFCPSSLKWALARAGLSPIRLELYRTQDCLGAPEGDLHARLQARGLRTALVLGHVLGMGAGITCWARRS